MSFKTLGLSDFLLKAITKKGYDQPTPIQKKVIPTILERKDVLASAQTGTGKTAAFTLPILQLLAKNAGDKKRNVTVLVLTPTRELAAQVQQSVKDYGTFLDVRSTVIFGGVNAGPQISALRKGVDIVVATPGRLLDLHGQGALTLSKIEILVLDEADRMLDMGFLRDIKRILALMPAKRQNLLFSATFSSEIKQLANGFLRNPVTVSATPENTTVEVIRQKVYHVNKKSKTALITKLIDDGNWKQILVFTRTKHGANKLSKKLDQAGISSMAIHGNKSQGARTKALADFKQGTIRVLVATDIAARGLDIPLLPHVVNFELPNVPEDYIHRIGRTGRAGAKGEAVSLVDHEEIEYLRSIEKLTKQSLKMDVVAGFEPDKFAPAKTEPQARPQRKRNTSNPKSNAGTPKRKWFKAKGGNKGGTTSARRPS